MTDPGSEPPKVVHTNPKRRSRRQLVASSRRSERTLGVFAVLIIAAIFASYDVAGIT